MYEFVFLIILLFINLSLTVANKVPLLNFVTGVFTIGVASLTIGDSTNIPYQPYFSLLLLFMAGLNMLAAAQELRRN